MNQWIDPRQLMLADVGWQVSRLTHIGCPTGSRFCGWRRTRACPSSWSVTSRTWTTGGRSAPRRPRPARSSGESATWKLLPKPVPTLTRLVSARWATASFIKICNSFLSLVCFCLGVFRPDERNPSEENGGQQREEREEEKQKFGQKNQRAMLYFIVVWCWSTRTFLRRLHLFCAQTWP